jgi:hypothetical protein
MSYKLKNSFAELGKDSFTYLEHSEYGMINMSEDSPYYQEYLAWLAEGNEPLPADEPEGQTE